MDTPANTTPAARSTGPLSAIVGAVVLVVAIVFISQAGWMNAWYSLFKTVHVIAAIVWIGGGALLVILGIAAVRTNDPSEMAVVARQAAQVGQKVFAPAGIVVVLMGAAMMANTKIGWGQFWIIIGSDRLCDHVRRRRRRAHAAGQEGRGHDGGEGRRGARDDRAHQAPPTDRPTRRDDALPRGRRHGHEALRARSQALAGSTCPWRGTRCRRTTSSR